jgi:hypothetical protein
MASVEHSRVVEADREAVRAAIEDVEPFMRAAGFDEVERDGADLRIAKAVGLLKISLDLRLLDEASAVLAYEQVDGIFEQMTTWYYLEDHPEGTLVRARTDFGLDAPGGALLDATVIKRQRRKELTGQFDYLEATL